MSEWTSVLAVFWVLWAIDGVRLAPRAIFTWVGGVRRLSARTQFSRWSWPGALPTSWRMTTADVPLTLSPAGVCNRPAGAAGRPTDVPLQAQAWRWEEVREVGVAKGWIFINGGRFSPDTGHVSGAQLLELARLAPAAREKRIRVLLRLWLRPAHLRRRATVLKGRTASAAMFNAFSLMLLMAITVYVVGNFAGDLPTRWSDALARMLPWALLYLLGLHGAAVVLVWRAMRRLKVRGVDRRGSAWFSALLLPPQAMRLRMLAGEGFFPAQHPLAALLAWGGRVDRECYAFQTLADLHWPIGDREDTPLAREVTVWFRAALEVLLLARLKEAGLKVEQLFEAPMRDNRESCTYCPRCRDQFAAGPTACPHGVVLRALRDADRR